MSSISRIDQAVLLLRARLEKLAARPASSQSSLTSAASEAGNDPLLPLRQMIRDGRVGDRDLRRALVRAILTGSYGERVNSTLEFQAVANQVADLLEGSESGRDLLARALRELN